MAVKMTGAEYKAFMASDWGADCYMDDYVISVNGEIYEQLTGRLEDAEDNMKPTDKVVIHEGGVYRESAYIRSLDSHFKLWRKSQATSFLPVECPNDKLEAIKSAIIAAGGKVK